MCFAPGGESSRGCAGVWVRWQFFMQHSAGLPRYGGHLLPTQGVCKPTLSFANSSVGVLCKGRCPWKEGDTPLGGCQVLGHRGTPVLLFEPGSGILCPRAVPERLHPRQAAAHQP